MTRIIFMFYNTYDTLECKSWYIHLRILGTSTYPIKIASTLTLQYKKICLARIIEILYICIAHKKEYCRQWCSVQMQRNRLLLFIVCTQTNIGSLQKYKTVGITGYGIYATLSVKHLSCTKILWFLFLIWLLCARISLRVAYLPYR